jgi:hypothetical protein
VTVSASNSPKPTLMLSQISPALSRRRKNARRQSGRKWCLRQIRSRVAQKHSCFAPAHREGTMGGSKVPPHGRQCHRVVGPMHCRAGPGGGQQIQSRKGQGISRVNCCQQRRKEFGGGNKGFKRIQCAAFSAFHEMVAQFVSHDHANITTSNVMNSIIEACAILILGS